MAFVVGCAAEPASIDGKSPSVAVIRGGGATLVVAEATNNSNSRMLITGGRGRRTFTVLEPPSATPEVPATPGAEATPAVRAAPLRASSLRWPSISFPGDGTSEPLAIAACLAGGRRIIMDGKSPRVTATSRCALRKLGLAMPPVAPGVGGAGLDLGLCWPATSSSSSSSSAWLMHCGVEATEHWSCQSSPSCCHGSTSVATLPKEGPGEPSEVSIGPWAATPSLDVPARRWPKSSA